MNPIYPHIQRYANDMQRLLPKDPIVSPTFQAVECVMATANYDEALAGRMAKAMFASLSVFISEMKVIQSKIDEENARRAKLPNET